MEKLSAGMRKETVLSLNERRTKGTSRPLTLDEVYQSLLLTLRNFRRSYICLDALDECTEESKMSLLSTPRKLLKDLSVNRSLCLFVTGRLHVEDYARNRLFDQLGLPISITLKAHPEDIKTYISAKLESDRYKKESMNACLKKEIMDQIIDTSEEMLVLHLSKMHTFSIVC